MNVLFLLLIVVLCRGTLSKNMTCEEAFNVIQNNSTFQDAQTNFTNSNMEHHHIQDNDNKIMIEGVDELGKACHKVSNTSRLCSKIIDMGDGVTTTFDCIPEECINEEGFKILREMAEEEDSNITDVIYCDVQYDVPDFEEVVKPQVTVTLALDIHEDVDTLMDQQFFKIWSAALAELLNLQQKRIIIDMEKLESNETMQNLDDGIEITFNITETRSSEASPINATLSLVNKFFPKSRQSDAVTSTLQLHPIQPVVSVVATAELAEDAREKTAFQTVLIVIASVLGSLGILCIGRRFCKGCKKQDDYHHLKEGDLEQQTISGTVYRQGQMDHMFRGRNDIQESFAESASYRPLDDEDRVSASIAMSPANAHERSSREIQKSRHDKKKLSLERNAVANARNKNNVSPVVVHESTIAEENSGDVDDTMKTFDS